MKEQEDILLIPGLNVDEWFVCMKKEHDKKKERTIIGFGTTKEEAFINAIQNVCEAIKNCHISFSEISKLLHQTYPKTFQAHNDIPKVSYGLSAYGVEFNSFYYEEGIQQWLPVKDKR